MMVGSDLERGASYLLPLMVAVGSARLDLGKGSRGDVDSSRVLLAIIKTTESGPFLLPGAVLAFSPIHSPPSPYMGNYLMWRLSS